MSDAIATAADLNAAFRNKPRYATFTIPETGQTVRFKSLTALELGRYQAAPYAKDGTTDPTRLADNSARLLAMTLVNEEGVRLFSDREAGVICGWDYTPGIAKLLKVIRKHCGIVTDEEDKAKSDFTVSDFDATGADDSPSGKQTAEASST